MKDGYSLGKDHPGVYQGERQALNEDYTNSGFDRGHLNPNGHHAGRMGVKAAGDIQYTSAKSIR